MRKSDGDQIMGQPAKILNDQIVDRLLEAASKGHTRDQCAYYAGIDPSTLYRWINLAKEGRQPYRSFYRKLEQARTKGSHQLLEKIREASCDQWQAAAWLLERCHGYVKDGPPPVQITIDAENVDVQTLINEYNNEIKPLIDGPTIDLDED